MPTTKEMIEVMLAFERGEKIEFRYPDNPDSNWKTAITPVWNWGHAEYRIQPKNVYVWWSDRQSCFPYEGGHDSEWEAAGYRKAKLVFEGE